MSVYTMEEAKDRQFSIKYASFDSASDAYEIYQLGVKHWGDSARTDAESSGDVLLWL
jgi:hypothetical protein